jgi:hypothetical protein
MGIGLLGTKAINRQQMTGYSNTRTITVVCSWCGKYIKEKQSWGVSGISYSICSDCLLKLKAARKNGGHRDHLRHDCL